MIATQAQQLTIGDSVLITGGDFLGQEGVLMTVAMSADESNTEYHVSIDSEIHIIGVGFLQAVDEWKSVKSCTEDLADIWFNLNDLKAKLITRQREFIDAIKANPELSALQEGMDLLAGSIDVKEAEYKSALAHVEESALATWRDGESKQINDAIQVKQYNNRVLNWDAGKALEYALTAKEEYRSTLVSADKKGFTKLAGIIEFPVDVIELGTKFGIAVSQDQLIHFVTTSATNSDVAENNA